MRIAARAYCPTIQSLATLAAVVVATGCGTPQTVVHTTTPPPGAAPEGISVTGTGKASGQPNIARASVGVEVRAATAGEAMTQVNARVGEVIAALKRAGVAEGDLRTQNVALNFERDETPPPPRPLPLVPETPAPGTRRPNGGKLPAPEPAPQPAPATAAGTYRAQNMLLVTIRTLDKAGEILGAATGAGANLMFGLEFEIEQPAELEAQAREKAIADARSRAEALAQLAGVRLGPILSIQESGGGMPMPGPVMMMKSEAANVPVERGELTLTTTVSVVYSLAR